MRSTTSSGGREASSAISCSMTRVRRCTSSFTKRRCAVSCTCSVPGPYVPRASSASSCRKRFRSRALSMSLSSLKYSISDLRFMAPPVKPRQLLRREEIDRLGRRDGCHVLRLEVEEAHASDDQAFEHRIVEIARDHTAHGHLARGRDGEL